MKFNLTHFAAASAFVALAGAGPALRRGDHPPVLRGSSYTPLHSEEYSIP